MRRHESVPSRQKNRVSSFILASQQKNVRLPPAENFLLKPRGMHRYVPRKRKSAPKNHNSSSSPSIPPTIPEETSEQLELERCASKESVRFENERLEDAQGLPSKIYSAFTGRRAPENERPPEIERPLKPALNNIDQIASTEHPTCETDTSPACTSGPDNKEVVAAMSQSTILDKGKGKASVANRSREDDSTSFRRGLGSKSGPEAESKSIKKEMRKGKIDNSGIKGGISAQYTSAPRDIFRDVDRPTEIDKGKGKAVAAEDGQNDPNAQADASALDDDFVIGDCAMDDCEIDDSRPQLDAPSSKPSGKSSSRTPSLERLRDRRNLATTSSLGSMLRPNSPDRKPQGRGFTVGDHEGAETGSSEAGPSSLRRFR